MSNYIYVIILAFILLTWIVFIRYFAPYLHKKKILIINRREKVLIIFIVIFIIFALIYTFIQTDGTFVWR
jgi:hypothetical protein